MLGHYGNGSDHDGIIIAARVSLCRCGLTEIRTGLEGRSGPRVQCTGLRKATGKVAVRTLATSDGSAYMEIGYDLDGQAMYADHSRCCKIANTIVQRAPLLMADLEDDGDTLTLTVFVDGGLVEAFPL